MKTVPQTCCAPLDNNQLLRLGTIIARHQVPALFGDQAEIETSRAIIAGVVVTLHEILPPDQFRQVMVQWEIDAIKLSQLLDLAGASPSPGGEGRGEGGIQTIDV